MTVRWIAQSLLTCARVHFNYVGIMFQWSPRGWALFECSFVLKIIRLRYKYSISYCTFTCVLVVCSIRQSSEGSLMIFQTPSPISLKGLWTEETRRIHHYTLLQFTHKIIISLRALNFQLYANIYKIPRNIPLFYLSF